MTLKKYHQLRYRCDTCAVFHSRLREKKRDLKCFICENHKHKDFLLSVLSQACMQTSAAVSDAGETVTIIYEEDEAAYLYTPLNNLEEKL